MILTTVIWRIIYMGKTLTALSEELANSVESAASSVVRVEARRRLPASGIIWDREGIIVTANHVVRTADPKVGLPDGARVPAELIGRDSATDLAVLRIDPSGAVPLDRINGEDIRPGHLVMAIGRPRKNVMATHGIISAVGDEWRTPAGGLLDQFIQTDVVMYPGFSGGPLISAEGKVIGMNTSGLLRGISVALPVPSLAARVQALLEHGHIRQGFLGVSLQPVRLPSNLQEKFDRETALLITEVESDSPAESGGLLQGDVLLTMDEVALRTIDDLLIQLGHDRIGKSADIEISRGGQLMAIKVVIGER
jgi:S1-C subfamily serine protease